MAQHNYCSQCGTPINSADKFCSNCGAEIGNVKNPEQNEAGERESEITGAFPRMLAYIPGLFWIPLAFNGKDKNNRECANQGLLLLLYSIIVPIIFSIIGAALISWGIRSVADTSVFPVVPYPYQYQYPYQYPYQAPSPHTEFDDFGEFFNNFGESFNNFGAMYTPTVLNKVNFSNAIIGLCISLIHTLFILYIPINSIWGFIHCIGHSDPHILPVIGKIKIISSK